MTMPSSSRPLPRHVVVIGAAGGLGQGILTVCRVKNISFTAIVRAAINSRGKDERSVASVEFDRTLNSLCPVSYQAMGQ